MLKLSFHNRHAVSEEYTAKKGHNRCIYCQQEYHPDFNKHQNTFMRAGCHYHLAHRQCILQKYIYRPSISLEDIQCELCLQIKRFDEKNARVQVRKQKIIDRELDYQYEEIEQILNQVQKKGFYKFK